MCAARQVNGGCGKVVKGLEHALFDLPCRERDRSVEPANAASTRQAGRNRVVIGGEVGAVHFLDWLIDPYLGLKGFYSSRSYHSL